MVSLPKYGGVPMFVGGQEIAGVKADICRQPIGTKHSDFSGSFVPRIGGKVKKEKICQTLRESRKKRLKNRRHSGIDIICKL